MHNARAATLYVLSASPVIAHSLLPSPPAGEGRPQAGWGLNLEALLHQSFQKFSLDYRDRRLATELAYGVVRNLITLDHSLSFYIKKSIKVQPEIRNILRLGAYQILYLTKIPARAAVDEAVEQAKKCAGKGGSGFVNAILRTMLREPEKVKFPDLEKEPVKHLSIKLSYPEWLTKRWIERYGFDGAKTLMEAGNKVPPLVLRAGYKDALAELFEKEELKAEAGRYAPDALIVKTHRPVPELPGYNEGLFSVQDEAAQIVSLLVAPEPGDLILDPCAAPGGKSAHLASMAGGAHIVSMDISLDKLRLLKENNLRMKLENIYPVAGDAAGLLPYRSGFDRVLLDAPCTALGIIRRRPEIKYVRKQMDIERMAAVQLTMLENMSKLVKPGGTVVYSVCSTEPEEGEGVMEKFLPRHPEFRLDDPRPFLPEAARILVDNNFVRTFPHIHGTDGFFMARMSCR